MNYYLYKLRFETAVHFGPASSAQSLYSSEDHFCADTLFSALCHTALELRGQKGLEQLCACAKEGRLLLSDSMPWLGDSFYLPRPYASNEAELENSGARRKAVKRLKWVPAEEFPAFVDFLRGRGAYDVEGASARFGVSSGTTKAKITLGADSLPYQVGLYHFLENAGLWFLAGCATEELAELLDVLIEGLSYSGIGGKTSAGYGKFTVEDRVCLNEPFDPVTEWLLKALEDSAAAKQLLLSTSLPSDGELLSLLPDSEYMLTRRAGFIRSETYAQEIRKKRTQLFLSAGSVLPGRFRPLLYEVGGAGQHPVYRLSAPLFLGVEL